MIVSYYSSDEELFHDPKSCPWIPIFNWILTHPGYLKLFFVINTCEPAAGEKFWNLLFQDLTLPLLKYMIWARCRRKISKVETIFFQNFAFPLLKHMIWARHRRKIFEGWNLFIPDLAFLLLNRMIWARHRRNIFISRSHISLFKLSPLEN